MPPAPPFFSTSGVATEWRSSISLSCLLRREEKKISLLMFSTLNSYLFLCRSRFSFILLLSASAGEKQKKMKRKKKTQAQTFFCFIWKTHVHETLSPAGSPGLWKKRALWWRAACWACSKHTHSASAERSWERRGLGEHRGLKTAASDPAYNSHFTLLPRHHYNAQGRKKSQWQSPGTLPEKEPL